MTDIAKGEPSGGVIDGDMIYWESNIGRFEVTPHTSSGTGRRQEQQAMIKWKLPSDTIDIAFRFDDALSYGKIWYLSGSEWVEVEMDHLEYLGKHYYYYEEWNIIQNVEYRLKWEYDAPTPEGKWNLLAKFSDETWEYAYANDRYIDLDPWWDTDWQYRKMIRLDSSFLTVSNEYIDTFPILINVSAEISSLCQSDGDDLRFTAEDNSTILDHQLERPFDDSTYNIVFVNVTDIYSDYDTTFMMYYGNAGATNGQSNHTFDNSKWLGVYFLNEDSGTTVYDATAQKHDGTYYGSLPTRNDSRLKNRGWGYSQYFDGTGDYIKLPQGVSWTEKGISGGVMLHMTYAFYDSGEPTRCYYQDYTSGDDYFKFDNTGGLSSYRLRPRLWTNGSGEVTPTEGYNVGLSANKFHSFGQGYGYNKDTASWRTGEFGYEQGGNYGTATHDASCRPDGTWDGGSSVTVGANYSNDNEHWGEIDAIMVHCMNTNETTKDLFKASLYETDGFITFSDLPFEVRVRTNETTDITTSTATLNGWVDTDKPPSGAYTCGFLIGNEYPVTDANALRNITVGSYTSNQEYNYAITGLDTGTPFYVAGWMYNATYWNLSSFYDDFYTIPLVVSSFTATYDESNYEVDLAWVKDGNGTIQIQRSETGIPTGPTDGTTIYSGTGTSYADADVVEGHYYFYRVWTLSDVYSIESKNTSASVQAEWWDGDWSYNTRITINESFSTDGAFAYNYAMLINISAEISANCSNDAKDIRFISPMNTEYYYTLGETWNPASFNWVWVNVSTINTSKDHVFYMYYGNPTATDNQNNDQTFADDMYCAVYYMNETTGTTMHDYSGNNNDGTYRGSMPTGNTTRKGICQWFDGNNDFIDLPSECHDALNADGGGIVSEIIQNSPEHSCYFYYDYNADVETIKLSQVDHKWRIDGTPGWGLDVNWFSRYNNADYTWQMHSMVFDNTQSPAYWMGGGGNDGSPEVTWAKGEDFRTGTTGDVSAFDGAFDSFTIGANEASANELTGWMDTLIIFYDYMNYNGWSRNLYHMFNETDGFMVFGESSNFVVTESVDDIATTTATLNGWLSNSALLSGNYDCGFWYGTTSPVTEANAVANVSSGSTAKGAFFDYPVTGLSTGTTYYVKAWCSNASFFFSGPQVSFVSIPVVPTGFTLALNSTASGVNIAWTHSGTTVITRKYDSYPTTPDDGTQVYNSTGNSYTDSNLQGKRCFYKCWGYANPFSGENASANISVPPDPPTGVAITISATTFDITWTNGTGARTTMVRRKQGSLPTGPTDGDLVYNGTDKTVTSSFFQDDYHYSLWSYANGTYSTKVDVEVGGLVANCYDEETNIPLEFDVAIFNQDGSQSYESRNNTNPHTLNISQLPLGDQIRFVFSASQNYSDKSETFTGYAIDENFTITYIVLLLDPKSKVTTNVTTINTTSGTNYYPPFTLEDDLITILPDASPEFNKIIVNYTYEEYETRTYYQDLDESSFYLLNAYLPPVENAELYLLEVVDQYGEPIEDAFIEVKRSVNESFVDVSTLYTSSSGLVDVHLIPLKNYIFIISKDGYTTINDSWTPGMEILTHQFRLIWETPEIIVDTIGDITNIEGTIYSNNTLKLTYDLLSGNTTDFQFYVYEYYNDTFTLIGSYSGTTETNIEQWFVANASRTHMIRVYMNHSEIGFVEDFKIYVSPIGSNKHSGNWLENLLIGELGTFEMGYVIMFLWYLPSIILIIGFGAIKQPGFGIIASGLYSGLLTWYLAVPEEGKIMVYAGIALVIGFITMILVQGKKVIE